MESMSTPVVDTVANCRRLLQELTPADRQQRPELAGQLAFAIERGEAHIMLYRRLDGLFGTLIATCQEIAEIAPPLHESMTALIESSEGLRRSFAHHLTSRDTSEVLEAIAKLRAELLGIGAVELLERLDSSIADGKTTRGVADALESMLRMLAGECERQAALSDEPQRREALIEIAAKAKVAEKAISEILTNDVE